MLHQFHTDILHQLYTHMPWDNRNGWLDVKHQITYLLILHPYATSAVHPYATSVLHLFVHRIYIYLATDHCQRIVSFWALSGESSGHISFSFPSFSQWFIDFALSAIYFSCLTPFYFHSLSFFLGPLFLLFVFFALLSFVVSLSVFLSILSLKQEREREREREREEKKKKKKKKKKTITFRENSLGAV